MVVAYLRIATRATAAAGIMGMGSLAILGTFSIVATALGNDSLTMTRDMGNALLMVILSMLVVVYVTLPVGIYGCGIALGPTDRWKRF